MYLYTTLLISQEHENNVFSESSIVAGTAYTVLDELFPVYRDKISAVKDTEIKNQLKYYDKKIIDLGFDLGKSIGIKVLNDMDNDMLNSNSTIWEKNIPKGDCIWNGTQPILPNAVNWKTFILQSGSEIQPRAPFECDSNEDLKDVKETYEFTKNISIKQIDAIHFWGDKPPPIIWNEISNKYIQKYNMSIFDSAYLSAYLNVGMHDAFVSIICFCCKYAFSIKFFI
jgi:hypothetical protein